MFDKATQFKQTELLGHTRRSCQSRKQTRGSDNKPINTHKKGSNLLPFIIPQIISTIERNPTKELVHN